MAGNIIPWINILSSDEDSYCEDDGTPTLYHIDVRNFLNVRFPENGEETKRKYRVPTPITWLHAFTLLSVEYPKEHCVRYKKKTRTLQDRKHEI
jgi:hypothetical protein